VTTAKLIVGLKGF